MMREFGLTDLDHVADHIITQSREAMLAAIRALPAGVYEKTACASMAMSARSTWSAG